MDRYGYQKRYTKPQSNRKVFKDEDDDDVTLVNNDNAGKRISFEDFGCASRSGTASAENKHHAKQEQILNGTRKREYHKDAKLKAWRMIIRNLPFKVFLSDVLS